MNARFTALAMLVLKFEKAREEGERREIVELYLANADYVNNWDLVDASRGQNAGSLHLQQGQRVSCGSWPIRGTSGGSASR